MFPTVAGTPYVFGPFQLTLPEGWIGALEDGVHELLPEDGEFALHIRGYQKDAAIALGDLATFARDAGGTYPAPVTLPSGLDGLTFDVSGEDPVRYWLIRQGTAMIAATLNAEDLAAAAFPAQMVIGTIRTVETE